jgi:arylsulfatase A
VGRQSALNFRNLSVGGFGFVAISGDAFPESLRQLDPFGEREGFGSFDQFRRHERIFRRHIAKCNGLILAAAEFIEIWDTEDGVPLIDGNSLRAAGQFARRSPIMRLMFRRLSFCVSLCFLWLNALAGAAEPRPNIVVVLADDLGYGDLACYGEPNVHTPHLDHFASEGLRFTDCYSASSSCSPARTGLMTGRTPYRVGTYVAIPFLSPIHLRTNEITVATLLRDSGYATSHVGKWHLNGSFNLPGQPQPNDHGFEYWFSTQNNCLPNHKDPYNFVRNGIPLGRIEGYGADIVSREAIDWLRETRDKTKPFFLYVCFHEPHEPIATAPEYAELYAKFPDPAQRAYLGNITQMDAAFGRLMAELDAQGLRDNTLILFTSDNGPAITRFHPYGSTGPLRAKKGHQYDGGIRVPGIVRWPGKVAPGTVSSEPVCGVDLLPTLCEIAGVQAPKDRALDGASILSALEGGRIRRTKPLYWQYNRSASKMKVAMRDGDWKMLAELDAPAPRSGADITELQMRALKQANLTGFELYNVRFDVGEIQELSIEEPKQFATMRKKLISFYREVQNENPVWPVWKSPRYEQKRIEWPEYKALIKPPK